MADEIPRQAPGDLTGRVAVITGAAELTETARALERQRPGRTVG
jgi:hypothetical protein